MNKLIKIFCCIILLFITISCHNNVISEREVIEKIKYPLNGNTSYYMRNIHSHPTMVNEFGYRGHDYILFYTHGTYCVIHNPDCHCYINK